MVSLASNWLRKWYKSIIIYDLFQEFFSVRNDASLFLFGSHSKKRPHNLVIGMLYFWEIQLNLAISNSPCPCFSLIYYRLSWTPRYLELLAISNCFSFPLRVRDSRVQQLTVLKCIYKCNHKVKLCSNLAPQLNSGFCSIKQMGVQSTLSKADTLGTSSSCPSYRGVRLVESFITEK